MTKSEKKVTRSAIQWRESQSVACGSRPDAPWKQELAYRANKSGVVSDFMTKFSMRKLRTFQGTF